MSRLSKILLLFFLVIIAFSCNQKDFEINETKWYLDIADDCGSHFYFKNDSVVIYECEIPEKIYGTFKINKDTIEIQTVRGEFDNEFPVGSRHRHKPEKFQLYVKNDSVILNIHNQRFIKRSNEKIINAK